MTAEIQTQLNIVHRILDGILSLSEKGIHFLEGNDYHSFMNLIKKRENELLTLAEIRQNMHISASSGLSEFEKGDINKQIQLKIDKFTKVDQKIFDIIKCKKRELTDKINQVNQGKNFLKTFKNQANNQEIFSQKI